jgi:hypothetical protein
MGWQTSTDQIAGSKIFLPKFGLWAANFHRAFRKWAFAVSAQNVSFVRIPDSSLLLRWRGSRGKAGKIYGDSG